MDRNRREMIVSLASTAVAPLLTSHAFVPRAAAQASFKLSPQEAQALAQEAWVFGMPLVYIEKQIDLVTQVTKPEGPFAPINQFAHYREFPDASNKSVVGLNVDTLYSLAALDLLQARLSCPCPRWAIASGSCS